AINTLGSHRRMAMSLGAGSVDEVAAELGSLMKAKPPTGFKETLKLLGTAFDLRHAKPKMVKNGPCKEVIHRFDPPPTRSEPWPPAPDIEALKRLNVERLKTPGAAASSDDSTVQRFNEPTLLNLPVQKCWPLDGGRFVTLPCVVT